MFGNDKGMSLIEVMIAAAISFAIALGVMRINESSQKNFRSLELKSEVSSVQNRIQGILMSQDKCSNGGPIAAGFRYLNDSPHGAWAALNSDGLTPPMATHAGYTNYSPLGGLRIVTGPGPDGDYGNTGDNTFIELSNGSQIPGAPNWTMNGEARFYPFHPTDNNATPNVCFLMIPVAKTGAAQRGSIGTSDKNLWFELTCDIDFGGTNLLTSCSASSTVAQGLFQDNNNGTWGNRGKSPYDREGFNWRYRLRSC